MGMFDKDKIAKECEKAGADVYTEALNRVNREVKNSNQRNEESSLIDTTDKGHKEEKKQGENIEEEDMDDYANQRMDEMFGDEHSMS